MSETLSARQPEQHGAKEEQGPNTGWDHLKEVRFMGADLEENVAGEDAAESLERGAGWNSEEFAGKNVNDREKIVGGHEGDIENSVGSGKDVSEDEELLEDFGEDAEDSAGSDEHAGEASLGDFGEGTLEKAKKDYHAEYETLKNQISEISEKLRDEKSEPEISGLYEQKSQLLTQKSALEKNIIREFKEREHGLVDLYNVFGESPAKLFKRFGNSDNGGLILDNFDDAVDIIYNYYDKLDDDGNDALDKKYREIAKGCAAESLRNSEESSRAKRLMAYDFLENTVFNSFFGREDAQKFTEMAIEDRVAVAPKILSRFLNGSDGEFLLEHKDYFLENFPGGEIVAELPFNVLFNRKQDLEKAGFDMSGQDFKEQEKHLLEIAKLESPAVRNELYDNIPACQRLGINMEEEVIKDLSSSNSKVLLAHLDKLQNAGIKITGEEIESFREIERTMERPEYENRYFSFEKVPEDVYAEHKKLFERINNSENKRERADFYGEMTENKWKNMDAEARKQKIAEFAQLMAKQYGLKFPYAVEISELNETGDSESRPKIQVCGSRRLQWFKCGGALREELRTAGIDADWVAGSKLKINRNILDDVNEVIDTVAHETFHAFQQQQAFLFAQNCFENAQTVFPNTPNLAKYYLATWQTGSYVPSAKDYMLYRNQITEREAFEIGEACAAEARETGSFVHRLIRGGRNSLRRLRPRRKA